VSLTVGLLMMGNANWLGGIQYVNNLARALRHLPHEEAPRIAVFLQPGFRPEFADGLEDYAHEVLVARSDSIWTLAKDIRARGLQSVLAPRLAQVARKYSVDLVFPVQESLGPHYPIRWLAWIPDFQHRVLPQYFHRIHRIARDIRYRRLVQESSRLVLSSNVALGHLAEFLGGEVPPKVHVLRFTVVPDDRWFQIDCNEVRKHYALPDRYLIVPNQFWSHKNHQDVFEAVRILLAERLEPVIVCTGERHDPRRSQHFGRLMRFLEANRLAGAVRILGAVPRLHQIALLRGSLAVVQPSFFEGWSTVIEEARALAKPVIASDLRVHLEQAHPNARYFTPGNPEQLARLIAEAWQNLPPGPDLPLEAAVQVDQIRRVRQFADDFRTIAIRALSG